MNQTAPATPKLHYNGSAQMRRFRWFVAVSAVSLVAIVALPESAAANAAFIYSVFGIGVAVVRCWTLRGPVRLPAVIIAVAGVAVLASGLVRDLDSVGRLDDYPFPSPADVLVALATVLFIAAIWIIVRRRNPSLGLDPILDAIVGACAAALLNWSLILPYLQDDSFPASERVVTFGFSILSFILMMLAVLALVAGSLPTTSNRLLAAALVASFAVDVAANQVVAGRIEPNLLVPMTMLVLVLGGAGLMHPSVKSLLDRPAGAGMVRRLSNRRIAVLTFALVTPPAVLVWQVIVGGTGLRLLLPAIGAITLVPLVLVRLGRLVRQNEALAAQEATLRTVGERFVVAERELDVVMAVRAGLDQLFGEELIEGELVLSPMEETSRYRNPLRPAIQPALRALQAEIESIDGPVNGEFHSLESVGHTGCWQAGLIVVQGEVRGAILAATETEMTEEHRNALSALCRQGAVAFRAVEQTERTVRERSEARFASLIENSSDIVAILDEGEHLAYASPVAERLLGREPDPGAVFDLEELVHPEDLGAARSLLDDARFSARSTGEVRLRHANGDYHWFEVIVADLVTDPNVGGLLLNARAIDDRKTAEEQLLLSEARFKSLVQHSSDLLVVVDPHDKVTYASPSAEKMVNESHGGLVGRHLASVFRGSEVDWRAALRSGAGDDSPTSIEFGFTDADGDWLTLEALVTDLRADPAVGGFVLNARDITERKSMMRHLRHQATHDSLTGLANRVLVVEELDNMLSHNAGNSSVAAICIDLDDFRDINDSLGQGTGDQVLQGVAERLRSALEFGDQAARIGADEFAVIVERAHGEEIVLEIAQQILEQIAEPLSIDGRRLTLSASAGIAVDHDRGLVGEGLLRNSITAMHQAKRDGRSQVVRFERSMRTASSDRLELRADLARAIGTEQLVVFYQPIVDLEDGSMLGAEALVRWDHPERGRLSPAMFVPIAEDAGLIEGLDAQVRRQACEDLASWRAEVPGATDLYVTTNLSVQELHSDHLLSSVLRDLRETGLPPDRLLLEVTESNLLDDSDLVRQHMASLRANGIKIGIDDFGTGYSSLGYIHRFEFDLLKIDRSFVVGLARATNQRIVSAVLDLASDLGANVVAEGIETPSQEQQLLDLGCRRGQGYLYSRPVPAAQFRRLLTSTESLQSH